MELTATFEQLLDSLGHSQPGAYTEIRTERGAHRSFHTTVESAATTVRSLDDGATKIWFGVVPRVREGGKAEDVGLPSALWVDIDPEGEALSPAYWENVLSHLVASALPKPSVVVHSGRGIHLYWLLSSRISHAQFRARQRRLIEVLGEVCELLPCGPDVAIHDLPRVMSAPGTTNPKVGKRVTIIDYDPDLRYDGLNEFEEASQASPPLTTTPLEDRVNAGGRNNLITQIAIHMRRLRPSQELLRQLVLAANNLVCDPPLDQAEVEGIVNRINDTTPQMSVISGDTPINTETDLIAAMANALSGRVKSVWAGGRATWYQWCPVTNVWRPLPPHSLIAEWLSVQINGIEDAPRVFTSAATGSGLDRLASAMGKMSELPTFVFGSDMDSQRDYLPLRGGYLNLVTGEVCEPDPSFLFTRRAEVEWDESAGCPLWHAFLDRVMVDKQEQRFLGQVFYLCLTGRTPRQLFVNYGEAFNGKSVAWSVLMSLMGGFASPGLTSVITESKADSSHDSAITQLKGKRLAVYDELTDKHRFNSAQVKRLCPGGDGRVVGREAYAPTAEDFKLTTKHVVLTNFVPQFDGGDLAMADRLRYLHWRERITKQEQDPDLAQKIFEQEGAGVLQWIMSHRESVIEHKYDPPMPARFADECAELVREANPVIEFVERNIAIDPTSAVSNKQLVDRWNDQTGERVALNKSHSLRETIMRYLQKQPGYDPATCRITKAQGSVKLHGIRLLPTAGIGSDGKVEVL